MLPQRKSEQEIQSAALNTPPFTASFELYRNLRISPDGTSISRISSLATIPSSQDRHESPEKTYLPGQPRISLSGSELADYLHSEFVTPDLDKLGPHLWLVAKQDSTHISALSEQLVRGRRPVVTENPELHLVWAYDVVYVKPIPKYLLSHAFWDFFLTDRTRTSRLPIPEAVRDEIARAALGFLRSYAYLVRHKSDFQIATDEKLSLLPKGVRFSEFMRFIAALETVPDAAVSPRYHFGQLRLTRLNFWAKFFLCRFTFHKMHWQYATLFATYYAPLLFVFGLLSVGLSAMQVVLAAAQQEQGQRPQGVSWTSAPSLVTASSVFSVLTLFVVATAVVFLVVILLAHALREFMYSLKDLYLRSRSK